MMESSSWPYTDTPTIPSAGEFPYFERKNGDKKESRQGRALISMAPHSQGALGDDPLDKTTKLSLNEMRSSCLKDFWMLK